MVLNERDLQIGITDALLALHQMQNIPWPLCLFTREVALILHRRPLLHPNELTNLDVSLQVCGSQEMGLSMLVKFYKDAKRRRVFHYAPCMDVVNRHLHDLVYGGRLLYPFFDACFLGR